jgi:hypothetical protein
MPEVACTLALEGFYLDRTLFHTSSRFSTIDPALQQILLDVINICQLFNRKHAAFGLEPHLLQEVIVSVGSRLMRLHSLLEPPLTSPLESVCYIGLTSFMTTLFLQYGHRRPMKYRLVAQRVKDVVERGIGEEHSDTMLWLLFIGGVAGLDGVCHRDWLVSRIRRMARASGIEDWVSLRSLLGKFPWIGCHHDAAGKALWVSVGEVAEWS